MKKAIVVRKNKAQKVCIWFLLVLVICAAVTVCLLWAPFVQSIFLFLPIILPVLFMALYYETWQVSFGLSEITVNCLFFAQKIYYYRQISDVYIAYSYTLHEHICLSFSDGKKIILRMEDENTGKAKRVIQSHHSIRILNWN